MEKIVQDIKERVQYTTLTFAVSNSKIKPRTKKSIKIKGEAYAEE